VRAQGDASADAVATRLQWAMMEARSYEHVSLPRERGMVAYADESIPATYRPRRSRGMDGIRQGMVALVGKDGSTAEEEFGKASQAANTLSDLICPPADMNLGQAMMVEGKHSAAVSQANLVYPRMLASWR
jgi:hypothetical protein